MAGGTDTAVLIRSMKPVLAAGIYVFATLPPGTPVPQSVLPVMTFREEEGLTLILSQDGAVAAGLAGSFPCRMITLSVHSALEAVGFLATVAARLAAAGISVNAVSGFRHDHLFVPVDRAYEAVEILERFARGERS